MKKLFFIGFCIVNGYSVLAQKISPVDVILTRVDSLRDKARYSEAIIAADSAVRLAKKTDDLKGEADAYARIVWINALQGYSDEAMAFCQKGLQIRKNILHDDFGTAKVYNNMSSIALDQGDMNEAKKFVELAIEYCPEDSIAELSKIYNNQSNILEDLGMDEEAIEVNRNAINFFPLTKDTFTRVQTGHNMAKKMIGLSRFGEAKAEIDFIRTLLPAIARRDSITVGRVYEITGMYFLQRPDCQADSAIFYLQKAKEIFNNFPEALPEMGNVLFNLGQACIVNNDLVQARTFYLEALNISPGDDANNSYNVSIQSMIFRVDAQIENNKTQKRENLLLLVLLIAAVSVLISLYINLKNQKLLLHKEKENARLSQENFQLKHDVVKNGLNNIDSVLTSGISGLDDASPGFGLLKKIRSMIARMLIQVGYGFDGEKGPETLIPFVKELEIQAEEIFPGAQNYSYLEGFDDSPMSEKLRVQLSLIFSEAFMNIKKHSGCTEASFEVMVNEDGLTLKIEDNGQGFDPTKVQSRGLRNIESRAFEIDGYCKIISAPNMGTKIIIVVPSFPE